MAIERKFVNDGYVKASMDEYFAEQLNRAGYGGMELNRTPMGTQIIIYSEKPGMVIGKAGKVSENLPVTLQQNTTSKTARLTLRRSRSLNSMPR
jgi:ribosomal protein S3